MTIRSLTTRFMGQIVCNCPTCQELVLWEFRSLSATFGYVSDANKTLDKSAEACQG